ncbi:MAG: TIGR03086 family metal-binding protein [Ilumatobacter sp.]|uniref:TIGR03086 family metal-binding protein n=1 Tax=Ilumatobacter sp. TaxID=1967498 RepID=UPI00391D9A66
MSNTSDELPVFPTSAPAVFCDPDATPGLFTTVLERLAAVVDVDDDQLGLATPCVGFTVGELRSHVLGWLQFFAAALSDPAAATARPDPETFALTDGTAASEIVRNALSVIHQAIADDAAGQLVVMSGSRMAGDAVLGMALGEYIIHAWDLATATGQPYSAPESAIRPAHEFLEGMVAPEYRGPDSGFFDAEVSVPDDASPLDQLVGFAGRDPQWQAS